MIDQQEKQDKQEKYKKQKAYLAALAICIRDTEPGSAKNADLLWLIKHRETILKHRRLIELLGEKH